MSGPLCCFNNITSGISLWSRPRLLRATISPLPLRLSNVLSNEIWPTLSQYIFPNEHMWNFTLYLHALTFSLGRYGWWFASNSRLDGLCSQIESVVLCILNHRGTRFSFSHVQILIFILQSKYMQLAGWLPIDPITAVSERPRRWRTCCWWL